MKLYAEEQLVWMALSDLNKEGWKINWLESSGSRLWRPSPDDPNVLITFALNPESGSAEISFLADATCPHNKWTNAFIVLLGKSLYERGIEFTWCEPHSFVLMWTVRDDSLLLHRGVKALTDELNRQVEEGKGMVHSCQHMLTLCNFTFSSKRIGHYTEDFHVLEPLVAFVDERWCMNLTQPQSH